MQGWGMRTYWSAIFSSAKRVKRALFVWCRKVLWSHTKAGFTSKSQAPLEKLLTIIQCETTKALTGQALSDVLAVFQRMSDRRRLGIKNEAEGYGLIPLTQGKFAIVDAEDYDIRISDFRLPDNSLPNMMIQSKTNNHLSLPVLSEIEGINNHLAFGIFTTVEESLQINLFMQNEPNLPKAQMNVNKVLIKDYENKPNWTLGENEPKTNPIKANQSQLKPI